MRLHDRIIPALRLGCPWSFATWFFDSESELSFGALACSTYSFSFYCIHPPISISIISKCNHLFYIPCCQTTRPSNNQKFGIRAIITSIHIYPTVSLYSLPSLLTFPYGHRSMAVATVPTCVVPIVRNGRWSDCIILGRNAQAELRRYLKVT